MKTNPLSRKISAALLAYLCAAPVLSPAAAVPEGVWVRDGYQLSVAVDTLSAPRFLAIGLNGTLFVSVPKEGKIYACTDADGDGTFEKQTTFIEGKDPKNIPQGIQWHDGSLWYAQLNSIAKARDTNGDGKADEDIEVLGEAQLPTGSRGGHMWRAWNASSKPMTDTSWGTRLPFSRRARSTPAPMSSSPAKIAVKSRPSLMSATVAA